MGFKVGMGLQEKKSGSARWWLDFIGQALGGDFVRVAWRQLAGMMIGVW